MHREEIRKASSGPRLHTLFAGRRDGPAAFTAAALSVGGRIRPEIAPYELPLLSHPTDVDRVSGHERRCVSGCRWLAPVLLGDVGAEVLRVSMAVMATTAWLLFLAWARR